MRRLSDAVECRPHRLCVINQYNRSKTEDPRDSVYFCNMYRRICSGVPARPSGQALYWPGLVSSSARVQGLALLVAWPRRGPRRILYIGTGNCYSCHCSLRFSPAPNWQHLERKGVPAMKRDNKVTQPMCNALSKCCTRAVSKYIRKVAVRGSARAICACVVDFDRLQRYHVRTSRARLGDTSSISRFHVHHIRSL